MTRHRAGCSAGGWSFMHELLHHAGTLSRGREEKPVTRGSRGESYRERPGPGAAGPRAPDGPLPHLPTRQRLDYGEVAPPLGVLISLHHDGRGFRNPWSTPPPPSFRD